MRSFKTKLAARLMAVALIGQMVMMSLCRPACASGLWETWKTTRPFGPGVNFFAARILQDGHSLYYTPVPGSTNTSAILWEGDDLEISIITDGGSGEMAETEDKKSFEISMSLPGSDRFEPVARQDKGSQKKLPRELRWSGKLHFYLSAAQLRRLPYGLIVFKANTPWHTAKPLIYLEHVPETLRDLAAVANGAANRTLPTYDNDDRDDRHDDRDRPREEDEDRSVKPPHDREHHRRSGEREPNNDSLEQIPSHDDDDRGFDPEEYERSHGEPRRRVEPPVRRSYPTHRPAAMQWRREEILVVNRKDSRRPSIQWVVDGQVIPGSALRTPTRPFPATSRVQVRIDARDVDNWSYQRVIVVKNGQQIVRHQIYRD